jgi:hypothetical protein
MPSRHAGKTVAEILAQKRGDIKYAPLAPGSPSWDDIRHLTWEEIDRRAKQRMPGYQTIRKLLSSPEYDK